MPTRALTILLVTAILGTSSAALPAEPPTLVLKHEGTVTLPKGTHRPEIMVVDDGFLLAVVHPGGPPGKGQVKHRLYRFDEAWTQVGDSMDLTWVQSPWGEPADHRATIVDDELVVVYQALNFKEGRGRGRGGPAEDDAIDQSLMLARFNLDGTEVFRAPIVDRATDFSRDNFPDHCLRWTGDRLLISTGSRGGHDSPWTVPEGLAIREVDLEAAVLAEHRVPVSPDNIVSSIGNSLLDFDDEVVMVSGSVPGSRNGLTLSGFDASFDTKLLGRLPTDAERHFPTGTARWGDLTLVSYIARASGGGGPEENPYHPRLLVLDADLQEVDDIVVGDEGFAHVHPTVAVDATHVYVAWSRPVSTGRDVPSRGGRTPRSMPRVQVEIYRIVNPLRQRD